MTKDEFKQVLDYYYRAFPQTAEWVHKLPERRATLDIWFKCLQPFKVIHVTTAIDRMATGQLESVAAYEREKTALTLRGYAGRIADDERRERVRAEERERHDERRRIREPFPVGKMFRYLLKLKGEGYDNKAAMRLTEQYFDELLAANVDKHKNYHDEFAEWGA